MKVKDFELLKKMMASTFSENDGEALVALRAANKILAKEGVTWDRVFARLVTLEVEQAPESRTPVAPNADAITKALETALDSCKPGSFRDLLLSYEKQFLERGTLSERQREVLFKAAQPSIHR